MEILHVRLVFADPLLQVFRFSNIKLPTIGTFEKINNVGALTIEESSILPSELIIFPETERFTGVDEPTVVVNTVFTLKEPRSLFSDWWSRGKFGRYQIVA